MVGIILNIIKHLKKFKSEFYNNHYLKINEYKKI